MGKIPIDKKEIKKKTYKNKEGLSPFTTERGGDINVT